MLEDHVRVVISQAMLENGNQWGYGRGPMLEDHVREW